MSSLTIEMGLRRQRGNSPPVPAALASRDDMTLAQKQRLAVLAKMGVGPVADHSSMHREPPRLQNVSEAPVRGPPPMDRKQAMLEKERRFREQEEKQQEVEAKEEQTRREKRARPGAGISRLGPVMPREDDIPQFLPAPMQVPPPRTEAPKMEIKISKETTERAKLAQETANSSKDEEGDEDEGEAEEDVLAFLRMEKAKKTKSAKPAVTDDAKQKPGKKKRKRTRGREGGDGEELYEPEEEYREGEEAVEGQEPGEAWHPPVRQRDGGVSKSLMVIDSVKGKVSTANRNMTDADLERRFSIQDNQGHGSLMTEEEVLRMIKREKQEKGGAATGSASRRVQRELLEWAAAKEQQRARVKSPHRFERMVVSRK